MMRIEPASVGCLAGLVSITGACADINVWEGALCGFIGGALACAASARLEAWKIDDPVGAVPVHFVCGVVRTPWRLQLGAWPVAAIPCAAMLTRRARSSLHSCDMQWGLLVVGLFSHGPSYGPCQLAGLLHGGGARLLAVQFLGALALMAWTVVSTFVLMAFVFATLGCVLGT